MLKKVRLFKNTESEHKPLEKENGFMDKRMEELMNITARQDVMPNILPEYYTQPLLFSIESEKKDFQVVLKEVQEYISANYSELITNQEMEDAKEQMKRYIYKYIVDKKIAVKGMEGQELIDTLYTEMAEYGFLTKYIFGKGIEDNKAFTESYMMESLTMATSFNEYIRKFHYYLYLIKNYSDYYLCLCENWDGSVDNYSQESSRKNKVGYTENVNMVVSSENREYVYSNISFKTKDMIPNLWISREKPKAYFFTPIHFYEHSLGYSVLTFGENIASLDSTYRRWSRNIMNALEFSRIQQRVYRSSFRDVLTGIYSRNGLNLIMPSIVKETIDQKKKLMCIMGDLDGLKGINDGYGHEEGDNMLTIVANALQSSCTSNEFCARIGGDEFLVVGYEDSTEEYVNGFIANVMNYIDNYNNTSKKCYKIRASFGAYCDYIKNADDVKEIIDKADKSMYINKAKNKK